MKNEIFLQVDDGEDIRIRLAETTQPCRNSGSQPPETH